MPVLLPVQEAVQPGKSVGIRNALRETYDSCPSPFCITHGYSRLMMASRGMIPNFSHLHADVRMNSCSIFNLDGLEAPWWRHDRRMENWGDSVDVAAVSALNLTTFVYDRLLIHCSFHFILIPRFAPDVFHMHVHLSWRQEACTRGPKA